MKVEPLYKIPLRVQCQPCDFGCCHGHPQPCLNFFTLLERCLTLLSNHVFILVHTVQLLETETKSQKKLNRPCAPHQGKASYSILCYSQHKLSTMPRPTLYRTSEEKAAACWATSKKYYKKWVPLMVLFLFLLLRFQALSSNQLLIVSQIQKETAEHQETSHVGKVRSLSFSQYLSSDIEWWDATHYGLWRGWKNNSANSRVVLCIHTLTRLPNIALLTLKRSRNSACWWRNNGMHSWWRYKACLGKYCRHMDAATSGKKADMVACNIRHVTSLVDGSICRQWVL